jgi:uncharacterized protein (TIGR02646 family)
MMKITKEAVPELWRKNYKKWGRKYKAKLDNPAKANTFVWATHQYQRTNEILLPYLQRETSCHCSFCDAFPLDVSGETIEHFRSKALHPRISYLWENLFYCCKYCNENKGESPERFLLKPDSLDYSFEEYFYFDYLSGRIEIAPDLPEDKRTRALNTRDLFGLNDNNRPNRRKMYLRQYADMTNPIKDDFPYRFMYLD